MLFPYEPEIFWKSMRELIREELNNKTPETDVSVSLETPGLTYKPLFKISEVCKIFQVTKPTIYDWVRHGKLKPYKIRSRVYFLWKDVQALMNPTDPNLPTT